MTIPPLPWQYCFAVLRAPVSRLEAPILGARDKDFDLISLKNCPTTDYLLFLLLFVLLSGCGTMQNGRGWGQDATIAPGWSRVGTAALNALTAAETWAPAAGAAAFQIGHADRKVSDWAARNTPVYGSRHSADRASDRLLYASGAIWAGTGAAAPSGDEAGEWTLNKIRGFSAETGGGLAALGVVEILKKESDRSRPDNTDRESFPSGHGAGVSYFLTLSSRHIDTYGWSSEAVTAGRISFGAVTAATAWARVEACQHYPSDVLAGIAIGHFFGAFMTDAFLGADNPRNAMLLFEPAKGGGVAMVRFDY